MSISQRSFIACVFWFVFVDWWATPTVVDAARFLNAIVIGTPSDVTLINSVPAMLSLEESRIRLDPDSGHDQRSVAVRAAYFVFVGW